MFRRNPVFSRRDFCSNRSNEQKSMSFIGLQIVRASWVKIPWEKPDSLAVTKRNRPKINVTY